MNGFQHVVTEQETKKRVDKLLATIQPEISRSQVQMWLEQGLVTVNDVVVKANYKCQIGDVIKWSIPETKPLDITPENIPLDIIYEDKDLLVVNKPKGMVVHPSAGHAAGTLVNALLHHCDDLSGINGIERPGIVHRIDKDTSGLLVVAKNDYTHMELSNQLANKDVKRKYEAIVHGEIQHETGMIDAPIGRDPKDRQRMAVKEKGKPAVTHFRVIRSFPDFTHIECRLETGRTHQIRVHMKYIGYPLLGDPKYGPRKTWDTNGQVLHAKVLGFTHPRSKEWLEFEQPLPTYFTEVLQQIEKSY